LCGVGGKTIEEAQRNISHEEFVRWVKYRNKRGSFNTALRMEHDVAMFASMFANRYREKSATPYGIYDFAPHLDAPEITLDDWRKSVGK
jgi:hypothetical protein